MAIRSSLSKVLVLIAALVSLLGLGGCTDSGTSMSNLVPVSGVVSLEGEPLESGTVFFIPEEMTGQPASGQINEGKFTMLTTVDSRGVVAGKYSVRIESRITPDPSPTDFYPKPGPSLIPEKYTDAKTSGLTVDVESGMSAINWNLKP
ncbi:MAG: hypothetical protein JWN70_3972 [Planctomycetaceae bacterium]|nr:hypothetical protein [Planctomycetaceae bacterium]